MLALSARQLERKDPKRSQEGSLALYQEAIHQLIPQLQTRTTATVASCVVLCVLEMMSCQLYISIGYRDLMILRFTQNVAAACRGLRPDDRVNRH